MIVDTGKDAILKYLANDIPSWTGAIAIGSSTTPAATNDTRLEFEFGRFPTQTLSVDLPNKQIAIRAVVPNTVAGRINEIGVWSGIDNPETNNAGELLVKFDSSERTITGGSDETVDYRVGTKSRKLSFAGAGSDSVVFEDYFDDLSGYDPTDEFLLAYIAYGSGIDDLEVRMKTDDSNHYAHSFTPSTSAGYHVASWTRSAMVATGSPSWDNINELEFIVTASSAQDIVLDGLRVEDTDQYDDFKFVSRETLTSTMTTPLNQQTEIEYVLTIAI